MSCTTFECRCEKFEELRSLRDQLMEGNRKLSGLEAEEWARKIVAAELREDIPGMQKLIDEALYGTRETTNAA
jgi:hypothetical protein